MIVEINTELKQITIKSATAKELEKLCKKYEDYTFISYVNYVSLPYYSTPYPEVTPYDFTITSTN